ncbi:MAG: primosomal protein N' [Erysipelotrichaceae bacterium]|nr:primosomal protein N' [Erysipelotrichaceae bacterium]
MKIVELLIEYTSHSLDRPFSYLYSGIKEIQNGYRVLINFNKKELVGYVLNVQETNETKEQIEERMGFRLSYIIDVLDTKPLLNNDLLDLSNRLSEYYLAPKISVLQAMLPPSLKPAKSALSNPKIAYDQFLEAVNNDEDGLTAKQIEILRLITKEGRILKKETKSPSIIKKLIELKKIKIVEVEKRRTKIPEYEVESPKTLTTDQQNAVDEIDNSNDSVFLLEGVTGSGKTEVYLSLSERVLARGKTVLMLVPEIALTPMMMEYFLKRFHGEVAILHSELTPAEKYDEYRKIASGDCRVVVGARSAIFAPLNNIGLIILDEEHTESYKQDTTPFYHARDVAIIRGKMNKAKVLLGSATPSLESRARAEKGLYHLLFLQKRINEQKLPETTIINLLDYHNIDRESYIFSKTLRREIEASLSRKEQIILLINRRGFSTTVSCRKCGHVFKCPNCGITLTYHKEDQMLKCHHCNHVELMPEICPECGSKYLMKTGFGTERIEDEVHRLFKDAKTLRLDSDSAKVRQRIQKTVEEFRNKKADILIGTQMIAKGHDFPNVTLVGVVLADIGLSLPSYRSSERAFELITQAVGRSGRSDKEGKAIIQTYEPSHYAITMAARQNYELFYRKEMSMRKLQNYPPYCFMTSLIVSGKNEGTVVETAFQIVDSLKDTIKDGADILGPTSPFIPYENSTYKRVILLKYRDNALVKGAIQKVINSLKGKTQISLNVNVDPYDF